MQLYSIFDVESIKVTPIREVKGAPETTYSLRFEIIHKAGTATVTFYSDRKAALEIYHNIAEAK